MYISRTRSTQNISAKKAFSLHTQDNLTQHNNLPIIAFVLTSIIANPPDDGRNARMIGRLTRYQIAHLLRRFPALLLIIGPRQTGKTTLACDVAEGMGEGAVYLDLE